MYVCPNCGNVEHGDQCVVCKDCETNLEHRKDDEQN